MTIAFRVLRLGLIVAVLIVLLLVAGNFIAIKLRMYKLQHADHARILSACREAIANRSGYRNDKDKWGTLHEDDVLLLPPIPDTVPEAIRTLQPRDIIIRDDNITINLSLPFSRITLIGFKSGAAQHGTFRYVDGLWFWNGNDFRATNLE